MQPVLSGFVGEHGELIRLPDLQTLTNQLRGREDLDQARNLGGAPSHILPVIVGLENTRRRLW